MVIALKHYFKELKKPLRRCAPELQYLISPNEEENRLLLVLEKAYLESRYGNNFNISDHDLSFILGATENLLQKAKDIYSSKMQFILPDA